MGEVYRIPFGEDMLSFRLPDGMTAQVATPVKHPPLPDPNAAIASALDAPLDSPGLEQLVRSTRPLITVSHLPDRLPVP